MMLTRLSLLLKSSSACSIITSTNPCSVCSSESSGQRKDEPDNKAVLRLLRATMVVRSLGDRWGAEREVRRKSIRSVSAHPPLQDPGCPLFARCFFFSSSLPARERKKKGEREKEKAQIFKLIARQRDSRNVSGEEEEDFGLKKKKKRTERSIRATGLKSGVINGKGAADRDKKERHKDGW